MFYSLKRKCFFFKQLIINDEVPLNEFVSNATSVQEASTWRTVAKEMQEKFYSFYDTSIMDHTPHTHLCKKCDVSDQNWNWNLK